MTTKKHAPAVLTALEVQRNDKGQIWSPVRRKWLFETPEEQVRQGSLSVLGSKLLRHNS